MDKKEFTLDYVDWLTDYMNNFTRFNSDDMYLSVRDNTDKVYKGKLEQFFEILEEYAIANGIKPEIGVEEEMQECFYSYTKESYALQCEHALIIGKIYDKYTKADGTKGIKTISCYCKHNKVNRPIDIELDDLVNFYNNSPKHKKKIKIKKALD